MWSSWKTGCLAVLVDETVFSVALSKSMLALRDAMGVLTGAVVSSREPKDPSVVELVMCAWSMGHGSDILRECRGRSPKSRDNLDFEGGDGGDMWSPNRLPVEDTVVTTCEGLTWCGCHGADVDAFVEVGLLLVSIIRSLGE